MRLGDGETTKQEEVCWWSWGEKMPKIELGVAGAGLRRSS
jgi:hypothetical protein